MRLQLISLDLMVALPVASAAVVLLFGGFYSAQSYLASSSRSQAELLSLYYRSQVAVSVLDTSQPDYGQAVAILANLSEEYGMNATLAPLGQTEECSLGEVCRVATFSSKSYILVVRQ